MTAAQINSPLSELSEKEYKRRIRAWTMYDWANSAFATTILAAVLPVYYSQVAGSTLPSAATATQYWSATLSVSVLIVAILSPVLGTVSDIMRGKKKFLSFFVMVGVIGTGLLVLVDTGDWFLASVFFVIGRIGFGAANVFYDALLSHVAKEEDQDRVSSQGYALGYLGGGLLLAINVVMIFTLPGNWGVRLSLLSVAIWWLVFSIPIFRVVPEPRADTAKLQPGETLLGAGFVRMWATIKEIRGYDDLFTYLVGFLIYNDAIGIIISVAAIYGAELGFASTELILAILLVQFVGIPYSLVFGNLPSKSDKRQTMYVAFVIFNIALLPIVAIAGKNLLPQTLTGTPSPDFIGTATAVGQGTHLIGETGSLTGPWVEETIAADLRGQGCSWYAFWCDESAFDAVYLNTDDPAGRYDFVYNGQSVELTYATGPDRGIWAVEIDGQPLLDDEGQPVTIDAYSPTIRYDVSTTFTAENEGEHTLSIINTGAAAAESSSTVLSLSQLDVLQPARSSNLLSIIGILAAMQVVGAIFAFLAGPALFSGIAERLNTKSSIMLALIAYSIIAVWGFFLNSVIEFWFLAWMVAVVQGGSQALSRSLYAALTPPSRSGEFFGFFSIMSKFASFISPLVFVLSVAIFESSRPGVLMLIVFFLFGMYMLNRVDVPRGIALAKRVDAQLLADEA
ncbi:MAG: MFS transporter [Anaerolineales bacterium]|nr:MFS transporter [Anaerolineales bacterium]